MNGRHERELKLLYERLMHFAVHNMYIFTVVTMFGTHLVLLFIMYLANVEPLLFFNILSVTIYAFSTLLCVYGHPLPVYICIIAEVSAYVTASSYFLGWNNFSFCYLCAILPVIVYFGANVLGKYYRNIIVLNLLIVFSIIVLCYKHFLNYDAPYKIENELLKSTLVIFSLFVMVFANTFYSAVYMFDAKEREARLSDKNKQLTTDASTDKLTGLLNRRGFYEVVTDEYMKIHKEYCVAFCDIDNFKRINDRYGHEAGDEILKHISSLFQRELKDCILCRWGGEETVIFMPDYDLDRAKEKMEIVRQKIEDTDTNFYNKKIKVTITVGIKDNNGEKLDNIIKTADERMYYGKQHGKNIIIEKDMDNDICKGCPHYEDGCKWLPDSQLSHIKPCKEN